MLDTSQTEGGVRQAAQREVGTAPRVGQVHNRDAPRTDYERVDAVAYDLFAGRRLAASRLTQLVNWVFGLIEGLVAIRLILKGLGANPSAGFAEFIYGITTPLVGPFLGLFTNPTYQNSVLDLGSIVALMVYALVAWLLGRLVWILVGESRPAVRTSSTHVDSRV
jgi:uncharacterized protein YggT (Ycf19 family)